MGFGLVLNALGESLMKQGFVPGWSRDDPMSLYLKSYLEGGKTREANTIIGKEAASSH